MREEARNNDSRLANLSLIRFLDPGDSIILSEARVYVYSIRREKKYLSCESLLSRHGTMREKNL